MAALKMKRDGLSRVRQTIVDMIASKKAVPMIVVMDNGYAYKRVGRGG